MKDLVVVLLGKGNGSRLARDHHPKVSKGSLDPVTCTGRKIFGAAVGPVHYSIYVTGAKQGYR